jgi:tRNA(Ile)-lysidine synthase
VLCFKDSSRKDSHLLIKSLFLCMQEAFLHFIAQFSGLPQPARLLLAVSGGLDSVLLCHLCHRAGIAFGIAHMNFSLRGEESEADARFVESLALNYKVPFFLKKIDTLAQKAEQKGLSTQMLARQARYQWFQELATQESYEYIATAHHQNDVLETLLLNLVRGTGIAGLHGILPQQGRLIRPLLFADREEILAYAQTEKLVWREDSSNQSHKYARNLLRHQVVPVLKQLNPRLEKTTQESVEKLAAAESLLRHSLSDIFARCIVENKGHYWISQEALQAYPAADWILFEYLKDFGFGYSTLKQLFATPPPQVGKYLLSGSHRLSVDRAHWVLSPLSKEENTQALFYLDTSANTFQNESLSLKWCIQSVSTLPSRQVPVHCALLDWELLRHKRLWLRKWQAGDRFRPLGMRGSKKVSDYLGDRKVPRPLKEQVWVLGADEQIVWVVGWQIDERFRLQAQSQEVLYIELLSNSSIKI